ncbi:TadE/TadG family type IV pilus assembly protein [Streptomyces sp. NBC_00316]|uniref:TadE/TadG family type IV pilus assembly protein n=1 Tax=Streptomyces sp. NBC_00316 TaxID=2975710 RepID=UPI002E2CB7A9|nr:TadE/TadG family type IV pilus assembly protein [Streptomyces sp. NBC_00316]
MAATETRGLRIRRRRDGDSCRERDRGQTAIEFVGVTPLIILLLIALWQCALIGYTFSLAGNAADEAARAGTGAEYLPTLACQRAAKEDLPDAWEGSASTECDAGLALYRAKVTLQVPVLVPGVLNWPFSVEGNAASPTEG